MHVSLNKTLMQSARLATLCAGLAALPGCHALSTIETAKIVPAEVRDFADGAPELTSSKHDTCLTQRQVAEVKSYLASAAAGKEKVFQVRKQCALRKSEDKARTS